MLPKPDKSKKNFPSDENINKVDPLAESKRLQKKRRLILISIIIIVGLSLSLWTYRTLKNFFFQAHQLNLKIKIPFPKINFSRTKTNHFNQQIQKITSSDFPNISLYVTDNDQDSPFIYQQNESKIFQDQDLDSIKTKLDSLNSQPQSNLNINLPQGLLFQEIISEKNNFQYFNQITLPGRKLLILISLDQKKDITKLVESIYWNYIQQSN